jgi:hypothetical protein
VKTFFLSFKYDDEASLQTLLLTSRQNSISHHIFEMLYDNGMPNMDENGEYKREGTQAFLHKRHSNFKGE